MTGHSGGVLDTIGGDSLPNFSVNAHSYPGPLRGQGVAGFVDNGLQRGARPPRTGRALARPRAVGPRGRLRPRNRRASRPPSRRGEYRAREGARCGGARIAGGAGTTSGPGAGGGGVGLSAGVTSPRRVWRAAWPRQPCRHPLPRRGHGHQAPRGWCRSRRRRSTTRAGTRPRQAPARRRSWFMAGGPARPTSRPRACGQRPVCSRPGLGRRRSPACSGTHTTSRPVRPVKWPHISGTIIRRPHHQRRRAQPASGPSSMRSRPAPWPRSASTGCAGVGDDRAGYRRIGLGPESPRCPRITTCSASREPARRAAISSRPRSSVTAS